MDLYRLAYLSRQILAALQIGEFSILFLQHEVAALRDHPHVVAAALELAGKADHDAFQPAHAHGLRGEQNPHRPRRL